MPVDTPNTSAGLLDGKTILRFAHAYESGGGTERYLDDLDQALLTRNAMTIVRLHITRNPTPPPPSTEILGKGQLIRIALPIGRSNCSAEIDDEHSARTRLRRLVRDWVIYNPVAWLIAGAKLTSSVRLHPKAGQAIGAGRAAADVLHTRCVDFAMLHYFGGADAEEVIQEVRDAQVPFAILNHYSNDRFLHLPIRKHAMLADGVAGVNGLDQPRYVRDRFVNLSDGIDINYFQPTNVRALPDKPTHPILLLPARVTREKGQLDLIRAAAELRKTGTPCCVAFAGRVDASGFIEELKVEIKKAGLSDSVHFLGALGLDDLRNWYAASAIVVLPTYHHEGLPRVILEAQAMERPVVAYATGGLADGIEQGKTGLLHRTGDIAGLTESLRELLTSPALRNAMGKAGRKAAESRFNLTALAMRHENFYAETIAKSKSAASRAG